ncbi:MAG: hypothetical protein H7Z74_06745 [Anaerolineae bacterium]|nr:hypothetical protein [Gemmatimonadaceae bacterium]
MSVLSVAAGLATLLLLTTVLSHDQLVLTVVGVVVLTGWALRTFWTRELRGKAVWRGLVTALISGILMALGYLWIVERLAERPVPPRGGIQVATPREHPRHPS